MSTGCDLTLRPCPVCGGDRVQDRQRVDAARVWDALHEQFGTVLPEDVRLRHAPGGGWQLVTCADCGLEHFADAPQGDEDFYRLLTASPRYYESARWEFGLVAREVRPGAAVVDLGCGDGGFLLGLPAGAARVGVDHNAAALAALRRREPGIRTVHGDPAAFARQQPGSFDVVTAFQVLEHVERPGSLLQAVRELLRPGARGYVSVPHRERSVRPAFDVLDHPPHHLTRWRLEQLDAAAQRAGLRLVRHWYEPPDQSVRLQALTAAGERLLRPAPAGVRRQGVRVLRRAGDAPPARALLLRAGFYGNRGLTGHTLLAELTRA